MSEQEPPSYTLKLLSPVLFKPLAWSPTLYNLHQDAMVIGVSRGTAPPDYVRFRENSTGLDLTTPQSMVPNLLAPATLLISAGNSTLGIESPALIGRLT